MNKKFASAILAATVFASSPAAGADVAGAFGKGRTHFVVTAGTGYAFDETYFVAGLGVSLRFPLPLAFMT